MPDIPRLNGVIKVLEEGKTAFAAFTPVDTENAIAMAGSSLDGIAFEMEHAPLDFPGLRQALQAMLDRRQIVEGKTSPPKSRRWCAFHPTAARGISGSPSKCSISAFTVSFFLM